MADTWDGSDDEWDVSDDDLDARLGLNKVNDTKLPKFDDEEDLALKEQAEQERLNNVELKKKGNALVEKKRAEKERLEEIEIARKAMELELELDDKLSPDERRALERKRIEDADHELTDDLFGGVDNHVNTNKAIEAINASDTLVLKDIKDHLKHARKVADALKKHGKIHLTTSFFKECIEQSKDVLDDDSVTELIKTLNVIKNEKVQAAKRKVKGQAQKATKKVDKVAEAKARKLIETFGDNDQYDDYDVMGENYEDSFF